MVSKNKTEENKHKANKTLDEQLCGIKIWKPGKVSKSFLKYLIFFFFFKSSTCISKPATLKLLSSVLSIEVI